MTLQVVCTTFILAGPLFDITFSVSVGSLCDVRGVKGARARIRFNEDTFGAKGTNVTAVEPIFNKTTLALRSHVNYGVTVSPRLAQFWFVLLTLPP